MRRFVFGALFAWLVCLSIPCSAQYAVNVKRVAIMNVIDKSGTLGDGIKLLVRGYMTDAVTNNPGYEGYDRVDIAAIMNEQEFQRTGMVSDAQIKKLGEMTGADYILLLEMAKLDADNLVFTSKILEVESAHIFSSGTVSGKNRSSEYESICQKLSNKLLGGTREGSYGNSNGGGASSSAGQRYSSPTGVNVDKFPIIYSMRNTIECDGIYKGPHWEEEYRNHVKKFHKQLPYNFNTKVFFVECSFSCPNAVPVNDYYEDLVLLSFDTYHRRFSIFLSRTGNIIINTNYGSYTYDTKCRYEFNKWNALQVSYNNGKVKIRCNDTSDELDVIMNEEWGNNVISTTYWGTMNTFKGYMCDIAVGSILIEKE